MPDTILGHSDVKIKDTSSALKELADYERQRNKLWQSDGFLDMGGAQVL